MNEKEPFPRVHVNAAWIGAITSILVFISMTFAYFAGAIASREDIASLKQALANSEGERGKDHDRIINMENDLKYVVRSIDNINSKIISNTK